VLSPQIKRLCLSLTEPSPEGEELEAFLAEPSHVLARISRDISRPDVVVKNLDHPMQVRWPGNLSVRPKHVPQSCICPALEMLASLHL
jgi:hypothetical protein